MNSEAHPNEPISARKCAFCGKPGPGVFCYRTPWRGRGFRDYFHLPCFRRLKASRKELYG